MASAITLDNRQLLRPTPRFSLATEQGDWHNPADGTPTSPSTLATRCTYPLGA